MQCRILEWHKDREYRLLNELGYCMFISTKEPNHGGLMAIEDDETIETEKQFLVKEFVERIKRHYSK